MILSAAAWLALLPLLVLAGTAIVVLLLAAFTARHALTAAATAVGLVAAIAVVPLAWSAAPQQVTPLIVVDRAALLYTALVAAATLAAAGLAAGYAATAREPKGELFVLLLTAALGGVVLAASAHFAALFLGFELLSVSLFALVAYVRGRRAGLEAAVKYLILSSASSAFLLFGIALVYADLGTLEFATLAAQLAGAEPGAYATAGVALVVAGAAFKLSLVPFHLWAPDVYQGAPAPVTAFLATVSKGAVFVVLLRWFLAAGAFEHPPLVAPLVILAAASMLIGNVLALLSDNVKRVLAYSSIAHLGYLLVAFIAGGAVAVETTGYYLAAYFASTIGAFGIVAALASAERGEPERLADYRGLFWRRPWLAAVFSLMLLSLAGIPLTMGFVAKFYVIAASVESSLWFLLALVIVGSAIGLYYYLRVLVTLYLPVDGLAPAVRPTRVPAPALAVLAGAALAVIGLGVHPAPLVDLARDAVAGPPAVAAAP